MTTPRAAGALNRVRAAGLTVSRVEIDTPDGPITLTIINTKLPWLRGELVQHTFRSKASYREADR